MGSVCTVPVYHHFVSSGPQHAVGENLPATIRAHGNITICTTCKARIDTRAESRLSFFAVPAAAIGNVERHHHSIALLEQTDTLSNLFDDTHVLVACRQGQDGGNAGGYCGDIPKVMPA